MTEASTDFNGFRFLPPSLGAWIKSHIEKRRFEGSIPWTPLPRALNELTFAMVTSAGINHKSDPPFDMEREKQEPLYGDRSYRKISRDTRSADIDVNHLHINTSKESWLRGPGFDFTSEGWCLPLYNQWKNGIWGEQRRMMFCF